MAGRNDGNTKVIFPAVDIADSPHSHALRSMKPGDYVVVQASSCALFFDFNRSVLSGPLSVVFCYQYT
jgi:hypothetical protein